MQELLERGLGVAQTDDALDVLLGAAEEGGAQEAVGHFFFVGRGEFEKGEVDVALSVHGKPGLEGEGLEDLAAAVEVGECGEGADQGGEIGEGEEEGEVVDLEEGKHCGCCVWWARTIGASGVTF